MRIALVHPPQKYLVDPCTYPHLGLGYLCAVIRKRFPDFKCDLLDLAGHSQEDAIKAIEPYDLVGYTASSPYWSDTLSLAMEVWNRFKKRQIVGGPHITLTGDMAECFDSRFVGPSTTTIIEYIEAIDAGRPTKKEYVGEENSLDDLPYPIVDTGKILNYGGAERTAVLIASRGCTDKCIFCCTRGLHKKIKFRSVSNIIGEMKEYVGKGIREFRFMDDAFTMSSSRVTAFCEQVKPLGVRWAAMARVTQVDPRLLWTMKDAGCSELAFGVESFDDRVLRVLKKNATSCQNVIAIEEADRAGINNHVLLMVSTPGETKETIDINIDILSRIRERFKKVLFSTFMPHPGCEVYNNPAAFGVTIEDTDFTKYSQHQYAKENGKTVLRPAWSPISIEGLNKEQQIDNIERFRSFVASMYRLSDGRHS